MSKRKERVLIFVNEVNTNNLEKEYKLDLLKHYCKNKNYKIINKEIMGNLTTFDMVNMICDNLFENELLSKVVVFNVDELSQNTEALFSIYTILKEFNIQIESINDGIIGKDKTFSLSLNYNGLPF